jgi:serine/threonine protein kinase
MPSPPPRPASRISLTIPFISLENYKLLRPLEQSKGTLYFAFDSTSNSPVILKTFSCFPTMKLSYVQERSYLKRLNHPNIIKMISYKDTSILLSHNIGKRISYIALEYAPLGDLCDIVINHDAVPEILARMIFHQIADAVDYLHENGTAHMDLKAENIVMDEDYNVKIIDLDNSTTLETRNFGSRGTPNYRCPEVIQGVADNLKACDMYSLGVILFILVSGSYPYHEVDYKCDGVRYDDYHRVLRRNPKEFWRQHSAVKDNAENVYNEGFKSLIISMLQTDPKKRASMEDVRESSWFNGPVYDKEEHKKEMKNYLKIR